MNKKNAKISLFATALSFAIIPNINAGSIKYYGSKAGLFRACKGDLVCVCKEVITDNFVSTDRINPLSLDEDKMNSDDSTKYVIVKYDGIEYTIPLSCINLEDGSIDIEDTQSL